MNLTSIMLIIGPVFCLLIFKSNRRSSRKRAKQAQVKAAELREMTRCRILQLELKHHRDICGELKKLYTPEELKGLQSRIDEACAASEKWNRLADQTATDLHQKVKDMASAQSPAERYLAYTSAAELIYSIWQSGTSRPVHEETVKQAEDHLSAIRSEFEGVTTDYYQYLCPRAETEPKAFEALHGLIVASRLKKPNWDIDTYWLKLYKHGPLPITGNWKALVHQYYRTPQFSLYYYDDNIPANQATLWAAEAIRKNDPVQAKFLLALSKVRDKGSIGSAAAELGEMTCLELAKIVEHDHAKRQAEEANQATNK